MADSAEPIVCEESYAAPVSRVWKALTDKEEMVQWFFENIEVFEPRAGFETRFDVHVEDDVYSHLWKVVEVQPESRMVFDWRYDGIPGESLVTFELSSAGEGATLRVTHEVVSPFPSDNPLFTREAGQAGWDFFLKDTLKEFVES